MCLFSLFHAFGFQVLNSVFMCRYFITPFPSFLSLYVLFCTASLCCVSLFCAHQTWQPARNPVGKWILHLMSSSDKTPAYSGQLAWLFALPIYRRKSLNVFLIKSLNFFSAQNLFNFQTSSIEKIHFWDRLNTFNVSHA